MASEAVTIPSVSRVRRGIRVKGIVQGVGFRPAVFRLARRAGLAGFVRNDSEGVWIEIEGDVESVERFPRLLREEAPPLSRIDRLEIAELAPQGETAFGVSRSEEKPGVEAGVPPDSASCEACLSELFDPDDRRYRYPFINCTDCGPRYTIVRDVPYDRARTTMDAFALCARCREEYEDPVSRRFHAEPNACPECGPRLEFARPGEASLFREEALRAAVRALEDGEIVAVKGLGGFHLAADAANERAVARLRERKRRPHKPFALMARDMTAVEQIAEVGAREAASLQSPARPIVLLRRKQTHGVAPSVAPGLSELGVMLPYTPLHHLILEEGPALLVMTSGNLSEEPIARTNAEAKEKLASFGDVFLLHDREIHTRADDSVLRVVAGEAQPVRRSRGFVPAGIPLPFSSPPVLAVGAELKNTVCLTRAGEAFLSPHVGDLDNLETVSFFEEVIAKLSRLLGTKPVAVAHDLHPDYFSTRWALQSGLPRVAVQHHHAHIASCLAEHGRIGPAIGIAFDGTGCGPAGDLWGGEILLADLAGFRRLGHLRPLALPGGEAAIRQPWRLAAAALLDAGEPLDLLERIGPRVKSVAHLIEKDLECPRATGAGRWFDAVSALCGVLDEISYEGQAAIELEAIADGEDLGHYPFEIQASAGAAFEIDLRPAVRQIAGELRAAAPAAAVAARFHATLCAAILKSCRLARTDTGVETVAFSGGCFQNRLLTERAKGLLEREGFEVLIHRAVPGNDGGLALGQAAVAAFRLGARPSNVLLRAGDSLAASGMLDKPLERRSSATPPRGLSALPLSLRPRRARDGHYSDGLPATTKGV